MTLKLLAGLLAHLDMEKPRMPQALKQEGLGVCSGTKVFCFVGIPLDTNMQLADPTIGDLREMFRWSVRSVTEHNVCIPCRPPVAFPLLKAMQLEDLA
jgi:hypothetical protein